MGALLQAGLNLRPILTHRLPVADFQKGFDVMRSGQSGKVVLDW
jgi:threonine 3-dehydrogenase